MGNHAKVALIFAQTDPEKKHRGLGVLPRRHRPGGLPAHRDPREDGPARLGHRGDRARRRLRPDDQVLGEVGDGFKVAMSALDSGRYSVAAGCVGICQYVRRRVGAATRPSASSSTARSRRFQLVQGDARRDEGQDRRGADAHLARRLAEGHRASRTRPRRRSRSSSRPRPPQWCANEAIQVHGGAGYVDDHPVERCVPRRARDDALRGHVADPAADHRPGADRASTRSSHEASASSAPARWAPASRSSAAQAGAETLLHDPIADARARRSRRSLARWEKKGREVVRRAAARRRELERPRRLRRDRRGRARAARAQARAVRASSASSRPTRVLASNTSSIPITAIASAAPRPERVVGHALLQPARR